MLQYRAPLTAETLPALLRGRASLWVASFDATDVPFLRPYEVIEIVDAAHAPTGLAVVDRGASLELRLADRLAGERPVAWVRQVSREGRNLVLDGAVCSLLLARNAPRVAWDAYDAGLRVARHARWLYYQLRPPASHAEVEGEMEAAYSTDSLFALISEDVDIGLVEDEVRLFDRHLRPGDRLLNVGCGGGRESLALAARGVRVVGVDVTPSLIAYARRRAAAMPAGDAPEFRVGALADVALPAGSLDAVFVSHNVYNSTPRRAQRVATLARLADMVRPGGVVIFTATVVAPSYPHVHLLLDWPRRVLGPALGERVPEPGDRWRRLTFDDTGPLVYHHDFRSMDEVLGEVRDAGLEFVERLEPVFYVARVPAARRASTAAATPRFSRASDVAVEPVGDELLLVHLVRGTTFRLNRTGRALWELTDEPRTAEQLVDALHARLRVPRERLAADVAPLLAQLVEGALLRADAARAS